MPDSLRGELGLTLPAQSSGLRAHDGSCCSVLMGLGKAQEVLGLLGWVETVGSIVGLGLSARALLVSPFLGLSCKLGLEMRQVEREEGSGLLLS